jgi:hypothetical protein
MPILCVPSNTLRCVLAAFLIAGCAGDAGPEGPAGPAGGAGPEGEAGPGSVIRLDDEPAGANCQNGGVAVRAGVDDNGNGTLEDGEIDSTEYVCGTPTTACTVLEGDYTIRNSIDLATFKMHGCSRITGNLFVNAGVTGLPGLESLTRVDGRIEIVFNPELTSVQGLANLTRAGEIQVEGNPLVTTLALPKLTQVDTVLRVKTNEALTSISLPMLTTIGALIIDDNDALTAVSGINALTAADVIVIVENDAVQTISGFDALTTVDSELHVRYMPALTTVSGFGALATVGGPLRFGNAPLMTSVTGFGALTTVGGELALFADPALATIPAFPLLTDAGSVYLGDLAITTLPGFAALERTTGTDPGNFNGGWFYIINCDSLTTVTGVGALTETTGDFGVAFNAVLTDLSGVTSLTTVGYDFQVSDNPMFPACEADAMAAGLTSVGNQTITTGNDTNATCS